jgi:hypothetical protein
MNMDTRTWNVKLMATEDRPETTIEGLSHDATTRLLHELMYGSGLGDHEALRAAALAARVDRHEGALAA